MLKICSVSMSMPTEGRPRNGVFVRRRLSALATISDLRAIMPSPWFPGISAQEKPAPDIDFPICSRRMFYLPGILKEHDRYWMRRSLAPLMTRLHKEYAFDLLDAHFGYPTGAACCDISRLLDIPAFITVRGVEQRQLHHPRIAPQLISCLKHAHGVIAVSHSLKDSVCEAGIDESKVRVIANAIDTDVFYCGTQSSERELLGISQGIPVVISVGSMIARKGYHDLLRAFALVKNKFPDALLVIVGGGVNYDRGYPKKIEKLILELELRDSVRLLGSIPPREVPHWLRAADVFALATYQEGCCNGVLEALACGLPAVVTPAGDNAKYVLPNENGYLFEIGDSDGLAARLIESLGRRWNSQTISNAVSQYGWHDVAASVEGFMQSRLGVYNK